MKWKLLCLVLLGVNAAAYTDIVWDFEDYNDHGFRLWSVVPATPAPDDPTTAGDEAVTGVGGPKGLPNAGVAWSVGPWDMYDGQKPAIVEGQRVGPDGLLNHMLGTTVSFPRHADGSTTNARGQSGYLATYQMSQWGDDLHTTANDQIATSPMVLLGEGAVLTAWMYAGGYEDGRNAHKPELDPDPAKGYTDGSSGVAIISAVTGAMLDSRWMHGGNEPGKKLEIDLSAFAGQCVFIELVDAFQGGWGWIAFDEIRITNAIEVKSVQDPVPAHGASGAGLDASRRLRKGLEWAFGTTVNPTHIDLYFGTETDPNLSAKPANKKLSMAPATTTFDPGQLSYYTQYYWRVDTYEPNSIPGGTGHTVTAGPVWTFRTAGQDPEIGPVSPARVVVEEDASAVFTATGAVQVDNYQWWRKAIPADIQLADGAKYSGVATDTLTINGVVEADEGQYYCVVTNQLTATFASNYESAGTLMTRRLIIHYPLDTVVDGVTPDVVGGFDMTLNTFPTYTNPPSLVGGVPQLGGNGLFFDNFDSTNLDRWGQYATAGVVNLEDMGDGLTIALWVNQRNRSGYHAYLSRRVTYSATNMMWQMEFQAGQGVGFMRSGATNPARLMIPYDQWQYVVVTVDKNTNTQRFYLNGELKRTQANWTFGTGVHAELKMGCNQVNLTATPPTLQDALYGILDDVRIYNYALTPRQIALDYLNVVGGDGWICDADGPALLRDLNNDCRVDLEDLALLAEEWLKSNRIYAEQ